MSSVEEDFKEIMKHEADIHASIIAEVEETLEKMAQFNSVLNEWISAIGKENVQFYKFKEIK